MMPDDLHEPTDAEEENEGLGGEDGETSGEDNSSEEDGSGGSGGSGGGGNNQKPATPESGTDGSSKPKPIIITDPDGNQYELPSGN